MGNICQISCDGAMFNRCLDCILGKAAYIRNLQENVDALETELEKLIAAKADVMNRVVTAERQQMKRLNKVQVWLSRVEAVKTEADELIRDSSQEIKKLCLGGYCSKNCNSSYKLGKKVARKLQLVKDLMSDAVFEVVAEKDPESVADEITTELETDLVALQTELQKLIEVRNDVLRRVMASEKQQMKRTDQVEGWLSRVQAVETKVGELIRDSSQEIERLRLGGNCSNNCKSSYKLGKKVAQKLQLVKDLESDGVFEVVAERAPESVADERPTEPTVVGLQSTLEHVWRCLVAESVGIVGLYGMGGVGKTTLLTHINNKFVKSQTDFDYVIWVVVSKDLRLENIQETIGKKIGLFDDKWKDKSLEEKAQDIFKVLREKKFVLLLDDLWESVELMKVGVPLPRPQNTASKVVLTTRFIPVCNSMAVDKKFKVECLSYKQAWELFQKNVGEETLHSHHDILELAHSVVKECAGLPLALIVIGRAMADRKTPGEWRYAVEVLRRSAFEFVGLEKKVYHLLKFSYDSLPNDAIRTCFSYCCLYPEDYRILKSDLIDCWLCEGFLKEKFRAENQGYDIVGTLVQACLLEEAGDDRVKMHDVIRDMTLWIMCEIEDENFLIYAGYGLKEVPDIRDWEYVRRLSLMQNEIENLSEVPICIHLRTLFLNNNMKLKMITNGFFQFMHSLKVLKMSYVSLKLLPLEISKLVSLQFLDISYTNIEELPKELKALVDLTCLNLNETIDLITIPQQLMSNFSKLRVLRMYAIGFEDFDDGGECFIEELQGLKYLEVLELTLRTSQALQYFLSSPKFRSCTQSLFLRHLKDSKSVDASSLANLKQLIELRIVECAELEELKIDYTGELQKTRQPYVFHSLQIVEAFACDMLKDLTFLVFAPNLKSLDVHSCKAMEEIISVGKFAEIPEMMGNSNPFAKLQYFVLYGLNNLKSIYWKPLPFTHLKEMNVRDCSELKKLPLDSKSTKEPKLVIRGEKEWWKELQWEDEATQNVFRPCFKG